ncbi:uncharacterized protein LOC134234268, partial [Saccostrea cucullata]|uniref:uncharacterized protein LOC134234268 n=1 Tax=Saccostrea cuccullata TaxID=36930 RepID=UPI002ED4992D
MSKEFTLQQGVGQGRVLSSRYFLLMIDELIEMLDKSATGACVCDLYIPSVILADDTSLISNTPSGLQKQLDNSESFQHEKIVKLVSKLLATGSSVNAKNVAEITPLLAALNVMPCKSYPHIKDEVIKILLDNGADINVWFKKENKSALCHSIESEEVETTKLLVEAGYDVNTKEADGELPIFCCLPLDTTARRELFCFLLESGTNPNAEDNKGICLLDHVFSLLFSMSSYYIQFNDLMQDPRAVELKEMFCSLLNKNANPNTAREGEDSLLIRAIRCGSTDIVLLLVQAGANIAHRGENKITAVDWCCHLSEYTRWYPYTGVIMTESGLKIMDILIENDMPLDIPNFDGKYPLDLVMSFNNTDVQIEEMLLRGADPNKFDEREESLLIRSVYRSPSVTLALLKAGAETKMKAMDGRSVYDLFIERVFYDDRLSCLDKECAVEIQMRTQTIQEEVFIEIIDWRLMQVQSILDQLQSEPITTETERSLILRFEDSYSCWRVVRRIENSLIISEKGRLQINGNHSQNVWFTIQKKLDSR